MIIWFENIIKKAHLLPLNLQVCKGKKFDAITALSDFRIRKKRNKGFVILPVSNGYTYRDLCKTPFLSSLSGAKDLYCADINKYEIPDCRQAGFTIVQNDNILLFCKGF